MFEPTGLRLDAATIIFNLPDYRVVDTTVLTLGQRRVTVESVFPPGCPTCGVVAVRRKERRFQPAARHSRRRAGGAGLGQAALVLRRGAV